MLENCCGTECDVMVPYSLNTVAERFGTKNELILVGIPNDSLLIHDWVP